MSRGRSFGGGVAAMILIGAATACVSAADDAAAPKQQSHGAGYLGGSRAGLLRRIAVIKDLALTDEQSAAIRKIDGERRAEVKAIPKTDDLATGFGKMIAVEQKAAEKIDAVLSEKQLVRFNEIVIQSTGPVSIYSDHAVGDGLKISDEQKSQLARLVNDRLRANSVAAKEAGGRAPRDKSKQIRDESNQKMLEVLTPEQRQQFEKMQGKKIDLGEPVPFAKPDAPSPNSNSRPAAK